MKSRKEGSSVSGVEAKKVKESKKKPVERFLSDGSIRLNSRKMVKLVKSSERLPPKEEVSCASDLVDIGLRGRSNEELPPKGNVAYTSDFEEKVTMQTGQLR
ncbi:hypothetical protein J1N35_029555 [Gossypium stocksii]|uniref:Uncharacterized protein n=1 Tax=Gossypium stocksii TaxID=47602 RepID=A0A9D3ZT69_9ROSI|nr:hypothetical protein J1N35_029555 [Gossypium stocksii]